MELNVINLFERRSIYCDRKIWHGPFIFDPNGNECECKTCGAKFHPMAVIEMLANQESRYNRKAKEAIAIEEKVKDKNRCKCEHCGKITKIVK